MSGFASLLNQFKETTQAATASGGSGNSSKRSRSSYESSSSQNNEQLTQKSKIRHAPPTPPPATTYFYPSSVPVKTIYIACPANTETGGPEALHQLCHMLNTGEYYYDNAEESNNTDDNTRDEFGRLITNNHNQVDSEGKQHKLKAYMLYLRERSTGKKSSVEQVFGDSRRSPRPTKYNKYNAPMADHRFPSQQPTTSSSGSEYSSDLVIWPECWTHLIDSLQSRCHLKYQIAIWWLSVNNNKGRFTQDQFTVRKDILHLVQSAYAREYVESKLSFGDSQTRSDVKEDMKQQKKVLTLTEFIPYTSSEFELASMPIATEAAKPTTTVGTDDNKESKSNLVVYNPAKGMHFTDEIIRRACGKHAKTESDGSVSGGGIRFCPIGKGPGGRERMTGEEVVGLLKKAKVVSNYLLSLHMLIKLHFFFIIC